ncbi:MAG: formylmethanofuran dehydrogenase subunit C [Gammaproteobacteria bacterium]|nr:formylmethanofuran dehydrogenase subunit C [Gammaproteobacteria bacterium]
MTALTLTLREQPRQTINMSPLTPNQLAGKSANEISAIKFWQGKYQHTLDDLFEITGTDTTKLILKNTCNQLIRIGAEMNQGEIVVEGDCGAYLGERMCSGKITVQGNCTDYAACELAGGEIEIKGNAGDLVGSARAGERKGMRGGKVIIRGNAGDRLGDLQRRGMILAQGNVGDYCASRMVAGTIVVLGNAGDNIGFSMQRGTVLVGGEPRSMPVTFSESNPIDLGFLKLMGKDVRQTDGTFSKFNSSLIKKRFVGDLAFDGQGEIIFM